MVSRSLPVRVGVSSYLAVEMCVNSSREGLEGTAIHAMLKKLLDD